MKTRREFLKNMMMAAVAAPALSHGYARSGGDRKRKPNMVVFLSDGFDSHSVIGTRELAWLSRRSRALLYWIRLESSDSHLSRYSAWKKPADYREDYQRLEKVVLDSGGRIVGLDRIEETDAAVRIILDELREQYVLGFYPELRRRDGSWHKVGVRVRRPGVSVRTRGGMASASFRKR